MRAAIKDTPNAPRSLPVLGHAVPLLRDPLRFMTSLPAHGDVVWVRLGPVRAVVVCDHELTHQVLVDDRTFDKGGVLIERGREVVGNGVGTCPHHEHRRQRRLAQPAFHPSRFPAYAAAMADQITTVTETWRDGQTIDVLTDMLTSTARTTMETMFAGATLPPHTLRIALDDFFIILTGIYRRMFLPPPLDRLPMRGNRRYTQARARLRETLARIITEYRAGGCDRGDVLSILVADAGLTDREIVDQLITLYIAGTESTATILAWAFHLLGERPELERRLHAEVDAVSGGAVPAFGDLPRLVLTRRIITETLRFYPPGWLFTRKATVDTELGGHPIPASTTVIYSPYILHHDPDLFGEPERFDPDRWAEGRMPPPREAFVPFGGGARKCLGDDFAMAEGTLALAAIAGRWRLRPIEGCRVRAHVDTTLRPRGLRMRVVARRRSEK